VQQARSDGARITTGGRRPEHLARGFFYEPTVVTDLDNSHRICQEEIFGPVAVVLGFDTDEEAVRIANDSKYGLSGSIWSKDVGTAYEMARRIRTGAVHLNGGTGTMNPWDPFGGFKRSGLGRELGVEGLHEYTEIKTIKFHAG